MVIPTWAKVAACLMVTVVSFSMGVDYESARRDAAEQRQARAAAEARAKELARSFDRADAAAGRHEKVREAVAARAVVRTVEVERVVEKPVYRNVCLDDDGLRLINSAVAAANAAGQPASAVPAAAAAGGR